MAKDITDTDTYGVRKVGAHSLRMRDVGPDGDSGTFEYFTEKVIELKKECRDDYEPASDDNVLVTGVSGDKYALGYFGYGYYLKSRKDLKGLSIAGAEGEPVAPEVADGDEGEDRQQHEDGDGDLQNRETGPVTNG